MHRWNLGFVWSFAWPILWGTYKEKTKTDENAKGENTTIIVDIAREPWKGLKNARAVQGSDDAYKGSVGVACEGQNSMLASAANGNKLKG